MYSVNLKKDWATRGACASGLEAYGLEALRERSYPSKFCGSLVLKSIKRSVINIGRSMFDVRCSTFNLFTVPARWSFIRGVRIDRVETPPGLMLNTET
jgi:hypothetical protein